MNQVTDAMVEAFREKLWSTWGHGRQTTDWPSRDELREALECAERARANTRAGDDLLPRLTPVAWNESGDAKGAGL